MKTMGQMTMRKYPTKFLKYICLLIAFSIPGWAGTAIRLGCLQGSVYIAKSAYRII